MKKKSVTLLEEVEKTAGSEKNSLTEYDSKKILSLYGIPVARESLVTSASEAVKITKGIGFTVALEVMSSQILRKTEVDIVRPIEGRRERVGY